MPIIISMPELVPDAAHGFIDTAAAWIAQNPGLTLLAIFLFAIVEATAVIGVLMPGTFIMMAIAGAGAMAGVNAWPMMAAALLGAVMGDVFSYWLGRHFNARLRAMWPLATRPHIMEAAEGFFAHYGTMSVALCRLLPVLRSTVPLVAGMAGMPRRRFLFANIASACVWAPAHIVPAQFAGISIEHLRTGDWRGAAVFLGLLVIAGGGLWLAHRWAAAHGLLARSRN